MLETEIPETEPGTENAEEPEEPGGPEPGEPDPGEPEITEIALDCGFSSSTYFSTVFRRYVGCTPRQWRASG